MVIGWDIGGAHVKASRLRGPAVVDVVQWPCPLWQGLDKLRDVLAAAAQRWPDLPHAQHAATMTGEMADLFADRRAGVQAIAGTLAAATGGASVHWFCGPSQWCDTATAAAQWQAIASANWLATAHLAARCVPDALLADIGSTTTDLIALRSGQVAHCGRNDAQRLASGELVYHGVVRTPVCAMGPRVPWQGQHLNVMNEHFATSADLYRLTGELTPAHDQQPTADGAAKTTRATQARLARMIGLDASDGSDADWLALARHWRAWQVQELAGQLVRVVAAQALPPGAPVLGAGCGAFLLDDVLAAAGHSGRKPLAWADAVLGTVNTRHGQHGADHHLAAQISVCAPAVAVARLWAMEHA